MVLQRGLRALLAMVASAALVGVSAASAQAPATITGEVTGQAGQPLSGVSVMVDGMGIGTLTDRQGRFSITVPAARFEAGQTVTLVAGQIGWRSERANVTLQPGAALTQSFALSEDALRLGEVVVTGGGLTGRAERLATARAVVDGADVQRANEPNIISALAQKAPNVITTQSSGEAGASTAIRLRGMSTITGTGQPTVFVDGVPINNATRDSDILGGTVATNRAMDINPDDIESIEILKGPAATSILGASAGAGGAIMITTRRGAAGETRYSFRSQVQSDRPTRTVPFQTRYGMGEDGVLPSCVPGGEANCIQLGGFRAWGPAIPGGQPSFNHADLIFENGLMLDNTLSVSGGTDRTTFYMSGSSLNHDGFIAGSQDRYNRYTARLNADHRVTDSFRLGGNFSYAQSNGSFVGRGNNVNGLLLGALRTPPDFDNRVYLSEEGLHRSARFPNPSGPAGLIANRGWDNPFFAINENPNTSEVGRFLGNLTADWQALEWLSVNYNLGADYTSDDRTEAMHVSSSGAGSGGLLNRWQFIDRVLDHNLTATASYALGDQISGRFSLGQNLNETYFRQINVQAQEFISPTPYKLSNTVNRSPPTDAEQTRRLEGYFGQLEVDYAEQLFVTARLRNDGSSAFGTENQRAWFPGLSAAWTFTRAFPQIADGGILSDGKLRASYGESGQQPQLYQLQNIFSAGQMSDFNPGSSLYPILDGWGGLITGTTQGNPALRPERVRETEFGIDLSLIDNRIDLAVTNYVSNASDVIFPVQPPPSTGFTSMVLNAGEIENRGWEVALNAEAFRTRDLSVNLGAQWANNRNRVTSLGDPDRTVISFSTSFTGGTTHAEVGQPIGIFRGSDFVRCGRGDGATSAYEAACAGQPDGALYIAENGFPVRDATQHIIGDPNPDWTGALSGEVNFRGVRLSAFVDHRQGGQVFNMTRGSMIQFGTHGVTADRADCQRVDGSLVCTGNEQVFGQGVMPGETVVGPGVGTAVPIGQNWYLGQGGLGGPWAQFMEDGTFTRLRELSLAYTFDQPWVRRLGLSGIDARIAGRNLALWSDYTGFDPEVHTGGAAVANRGIDWWVNPTSRSFVFTVGLNR